MELPKPWPRKPPKNQRCDAHVGWGTDYLGKPVVYGCKQFAVETVWARRGFCREMWLCEEHVLHFESVGEVFRNPRRKK